MAGTARRRRHLDVAAELAAAREGSHRAVARLISVVSDGGPQLREVATALADGEPPRAWVLGLTGSPGVGKSTTVSALVTAWRERGARVGVLAVDPSSPFSGGALLGDRVRMGSHALDDGVYVRSMASRGHLGGLAAATPQAVRVLEAAGVDLVLVETVGVGQSEVEVAGLADTTVVLLAPGMGDGVQAAKAGILEVADVLAVNKADRDGAEATVRELRQSVALGADGRAPGDWRPAVVRTVASTGDVAELLTAVDAHREWSLEHGRAEVVRRRRAAAEVRAIALARLQERFGRLGSGGLLDEVAAEVAGSRLDPFTAADRLVEALETQPAG
jgi:LAO/AO transport system kinase